jgi:AhpC/TSA family/Disulphide bond corrector protein DsbC
VDVLREFADRRRITYLMLSDAESSVIRSFGLFNETVPPGTRDFGIPHPALFFVDGNGTVLRKYMEERYYHRRALATILADDGEAVAVQTVGQADDEHVAVRTLTLQREVYPGNRFALMVDVEPKPGVHIYAPGAGPDYRPLTLRIEAKPYLMAYEPVYPMPDGTWLSPLDEQVPVYTRPTRARVEVALGTRHELKPVYDAGGPFEVTGIVSFQACSETVCWAPQDIPVTWGLALLPPDVERSPDPLRREHSVPRSG